MENYLAKETSNEKNPINSILDYKQLDSEINSEENEKIYKDHEAITEFVYKIAFDRNQSSFYTDPSIKIDNINNAIISLKKELKNNIPNFVDTITFIKANIVFKIQNIL
jgi:virulence-associated protein VapD